MRRLNLALNFVPGTFGAACATLHAEWPFGILIIGFGGMKAGVLVRRRVTHRHCGRIGKELRNNKPSRIWVEMPNYLLDDIGENNVQARWT